MADDEKGLMNGKDTGKNQKDYSDRFCVRHWKVIFAATGVVLLITLGVITGAAFNRGGSIISKKERSTSKEIRLPGDIIPEKYRLYLHPNITNGKFDFTGKIRILVECKVSTDNIVIHLKNLNVDTVKVIEGPTAFVGAGTKEGKILVNIKSNKLNLLVFDKEREFMTIKLNGESLEQGKKYVVLISYSGSLSGGLEGFYKSSYKTASGQTRYLATTHFEATMARTAFPCFDEPAMKATFEIIMTKEPQHHALSNMPIVLNQTRADGLIDVHFKESVKMSTYLVAFIVCDYKFKYSKTKKGTEVRIWAPPEQIEQANFANEVAPKVLAYYEDFFQVDFPLPKQDLIAIPDFAAGAMENWGLITYRLTSILYDENESSSANKQWVAVVIAHELAHQWFGNLVTMKWWNDLWLNEGFAAYVEFIGANHTNSSWQMMDQFIVDDVQSSMVLDSHVNSHPISVPVHDPAQINELFDTISYDKGASIVRMMKNFLGSDVFHTGLTNYLRKYQFSNAVSDDLWECLTDAADKSNKKLAKSVKEVMDTWTLQMGYPVITIKRDGKQAVATQQHFIVDDVKKSEIKHSKYNYKWHIPLTYYTQENPNSKNKWFYKDEDQIKFKWSTESGWLKMNTHQMGFYRVNYDEENWSALSKQLKDNHKAIAPPDRANLIDDAFELAKANLMNQTRALDMTAYLSKETEYVPWISALSSLGYIGSMLQGNEKYPGAYKNYEKYIVQQVKGRAKELGWKDEGDHLVKYLRGAVLRSSVQHGDTDAIAKGKKVFKDWREKKISSIAPNLRSIVYLAAIKYGESDDWNYLFEIYKTTSFPSEQRKIMFALTDTKNKTILKRYLEMSMNSSIIRSQDTCSVIEHISMNPEATAMAYDFVKKNWNELYKRYGKGSFDMSRLILYIFGRYKTQEKYEEVKKFLSTHKVGSGKLAAKQAIAAIKNHINWLKKNGEAVNDWLEMKVEESKAKRQTYM